MDGSDAAAGAVGNASFSCSPDPNFAPASCSGTVDGQPIGDSDPLPAGLGSHTVTVTATDTDGVTGTATATYTVSGPPVVTTTTPVAGTTYLPASAPAAHFTCTPDPNSPLEPGLAGCSASLDGGPPVADGSALPAAPGQHTMVVTATDTDGSSRQTSVAYAVSGPPTVSVSQPVNNADYRWPSVPGAGFTCAAGVQASLLSCDAVVDGVKIADGGSLPFGVGTHSMTVTATDADGLSTTQSLTYTVSFSLGVPPPVSIQTPAQGASYVLGQVVRARYSCLEPATGSALTSCVGTDAAGRPVSTSTLGRHRFTVTATNAAGESTAETVSYPVVPTTNRFTISRVTADPNGTLHLTVRLPGPGRLAVVADARNAAGGGRVLTRQFVYALGTVAIRGAGTVPITVKPGAQGRRLVNLRGGVPVVALRVAYAPTGGHPREVRPARLRLK